MKNYLCKNAGYLWEKYYPYLAGIAICSLCRFLRIYIYKDDNYGSLLDGLITLSSLVIGFIGAVMPVLVSMKNESAFVKYIYQHDKEQLFMKYIKSALLLGILTVVSSLLMHIRSSIEPKILGLFYYVWVFFTTSFLSATYRSMSHMITIVFSNKDDAFHVTKNGSGREISEAEREAIHERYKK